MRRAQRKKSDALLSFVREYTEENRYPPTMREIQEALGYSSTSVVIYNLGLLEREGLLTRQRFTARSIVLT